MTTETHRWKSITQSAYAWEQDALEFVKERLPDREPYRAWSNFEFIADDGSINEVDLLVLTPKGFFLVEIKSRPGVLTGDAGTWTWAVEGRLVTGDNPLIRANQKAKKLITLLKRQKCARKTRLPFLEALVFCSAPDLECRLTGNARFRVCLRDRDAQGEKPPRPGIMAAIEDRKGWGLKEHPAAEPNNRQTAKVLSRAMAAAGIRESQRKRRVGDFFLKEIIGEGPGFQDWRAVHVALPAVERQIRIYTVRRAADEAERGTIERAASREFQLLETLTHPNLLRAHSFTEHELGPAIIFEYFPKAIRLDLYLAQQGRGLGPDQRLFILRQISEAMDHAHQQRVVHRALSPRSIFVADPDEDFPKIKVFNWQLGYRAPETLDSRGGVPVTATEHVSRLVEDADTAYMAPEALHSGDDRGEHLDVFSLGAIAYHLFANGPPAANALELSEKLRAENGLQISSVLNGAGEHLQFLIQYSTHPDVTCRMDSVKDFLEGLDLVADELTTPDEQKETVEDPAQAQAGDRLAGGYEVIRRLGSGASAAGFLVKDPKGAQFILKIALDPDQNDRLREEAEVLGKLFHSRVVKYIDTIEIGDRIGILLRALTRSLKGGKQVVETLRHWIGREGRLQLDLLQRFGEDLLSALNHLEEEGISHRDIKPDNLAVANVGAKDQLHLVLFDFSLSRAPAENIRAGTRGYLDPFLPLRKPKRWDSYAERWAAAVTLYEMATGSLPVWHDGRTDPAQVECEAAIDAEMFEMGIRESLARFFKKALRRDPAERFDNAEQMLRAWRDLFESLDSPGIISSDHEDVPAPADLIEAAGLDTPISGLGLSTRAANALDRLDVLTVADLFKVPIRRLFRMRGVGQKTRREITDAVRALRERISRGEPIPESESFAHTDTGAGAAGVPSVDLLADRLTQIRQSRADTGRQGIIKALLGLTPDADAPWPTQAETARALNLSRSRVGQVLTLFGERWRKNKALTGLREDMARMLTADGGVMTLREMTDAVLAARGSVHEEPMRSRLSRAVIRAAVEVERTLAQPRFRGSRKGERILIGARADLADYALCLGDGADALAGEDPLLPANRALERLQAVPPPPDAEPLRPGRLMRLAAGASANAALSSRQEIYPRGMSGIRALKLSHGALLGARRLTVADIRRRVSGRYPEASPLPGPPELDRLLKEAGLDLQWEADASGAEGCYLFPSYAPEVSGSGSTRYRYPTRETGGIPPARITPEMAAARQFDERLRHSRENGGFIALTAPPRWYTDAIELLKVRFDLEIFHMEAVLLNALEETAKEKRVKWEKVVAADAAPRESRDWGRLLQLVRMAMPRVEALLFSAEKALLICYAGILARYDRMEIIDELRERSGMPLSAGGIPGAWLLIPGDGQSHLPLMEGKAVPVIGSGQHARVPESWLQNRHRADGKPRERQKMH